MGWLSGCLIIYEYFKVYGSDWMVKLVFIDEFFKWIGDFEKEWVYGIFDGYRSSLKSMFFKFFDLNGIIDWMFNELIDSIVRFWMWEEILMILFYVVLSLYIDGLVCDYNDEV